MEPIGDLNQKGVSFSTEATQPVYINEESKKECKKSKISDREKDDGLTTTTTTTQRVDIRNEENKEECKKPKISDREKDALATRKKVTNQAIKEFLNDNQLGMTLWIYFFLFFSIIVEFTFHEKVT